MTEFIEAKFPRGYFLTLILPLLILFLGIGLGYAVGRKSVASSATQAQDHKVVSSQAKDQKVVHIGDHFKPYLNFIAREMILEGETLSCWTAVDQSPMVVEKIVDGYARVRYVPQQPYETERPELACHPGATFKISLEDLLRWRGHEQNKSSKAAIEKSLRKQLLSD